MKNVLIVSIIFLSLIAALPVVSIADEHEGLISNGIVPCGDESRGQPPCTACHLYKLIDNVITALLFLVAPLGGIGVAIGGLWILTSGGSESRRQKGKSIIYAAVIGLIIAFIAWIVVDTIVTYLANPDVFPKAWNEYSC